MDQEIQASEYEKLLAQVHELQQTIGQLEQQLVTTRPRPSFSKKSMSVKIKHGRFQIETGIRTLSDLLDLIYSNTHHVSYLSPIVNTTTEQDDSTYCGNSRLLLQFGSEKDDSQIPFTKKFLSYCVNVSTITITTKATPLLYKDYTSVIHRLIYTFFTCRNTREALFHTKTFMRRYKELQDPMHDLTTLCICCYMCSSSTCEHFQFFSAKDKRHLADFFYAKAKSVLMDQFDDPTKRLENVMSINLLSTYLHIALRVKECRELNFIAYQICLDLSQSYQLDFKQSPAADNISPLDIPIRPCTPDNVNYMLYSRHVTITLSIHHMMNYITKNSTPVPSFHFPYWQIIEDEPPEIVKYVNTQNWLIKLLNHPYVSRFMVSCLIYLFLRDLHVYL